MNLFIIPCFPVPSCFALVLAGGECSVSSVAADSEMPQVFECSQFEDSSLSVPAGPNHLSTSRVWQKTFSISSFISAEMQEQIPLWMGAADITGGLELIFPWKGNEEESSRLIVAC